jgi:protein gp37
MADTNIEWSNKVWNPTTGCSRVSAGCDNCYAMHFARRFDGEGKGYDGTTRRTSRGTDWSGVVHQHEDRLEVPLKWRKPQRVFVDSMSDLFHPAVPVEFVDKVFAVMALARQHTFMVLTKRPERMSAYLSQEDTKGRILLIAGLLLMNEKIHAAYCGKLAGKLGVWPLPNVWLGTSVENQEAADKRIPHLLETPAAVRFLSCEPLLGPVEFSDVTKRSDAVSRLGRNALSGIHWVIAGGESGHGARPMHPNWARSLRDQCSSAGVPFFFKQWGAYSVGYDRDRDDPDWRQCSQVEAETPRGQWLNLAGGSGFHGERVVRALPVGKETAGRFLDGQEHNEFPERSH